MEEMLIVNVVHVDGTIIIEKGIYGLSRGNDLGSIMQGLETLKCIPLRLRVLERSKYM